MPCKSLLASTCPGLQTSDCMYIKLPLEDELPIKQSSRQDDLGHFFWNRSGPLLTRGNHSRPRFLAEKLHSYWGEGTSSLCICCHFSGKQVLAASTQRTELISAILFSGTGSPFPPPYGWNLNWVPAVFLDANWGSCVPLCSLFNGEASV